MRRHGGERDGTLRRCNVGLTLRTVWWATGKLRTYTPPWVPGGCSACAPLVHAGSWWEDDIDPSAYSRALMYASRNSCQQMKREKELEPTTVSEGPPGLSPACLAYLLPVWSLTSLPGLSSARLASHLPVSPMFSLTRLS